MKITTPLFIIFALGSCNPGSEHKTRTSPGIAVTGTQEDLIRNLFDRDSRDLVSWKSVIKKRRSTNDPAHYTTKGGTRDHKIRISIKTPKDTVSTILTLKGSLIGWSDKVLVDCSERLGFIAWISEPFYHSDPDPRGINPDRQFDLHLKVIDLRTGMDKVDAIIYSTRCCIDRLRMQYNPFSNSILFAFNDFSKPDSRYLMYGFIELKNDELKVGKLIPEEAVLHDRSEKRWPDFLMNAHHVFLYHTSGDQWSFFEHSGKQQIGISKIDKNNELTDYRILTDSLAINEKLVLIGDTIFFRVENSNSYDEMIVKKIAIADIARY